MKTNALLLTLFSSVLGLSHAQAAQPFDLEMHGSEVCKVGAAYATPECYTSAGDANVMKFVIPDGIDLVQRVKNFFNYQGDGTVNSIEQARALDLAGGSIFLKPEDRQMILTNYRELSVHMIGFDFKHSSLVDGENLVPFVASIRWKGSLQTEGTLQVDGVFHLPVETDLSTLSFADVNQKLANLFTGVRAYDSSTEARLEFLRPLEGFARRTNITHIYGSGVDVDQETVRLVREIVGPAIVGEVALIPLYKALLGVGVLQH